VNQFWFFFFFTLGLATLALVEFVFTHFFTLFFFPVREGSVREDGIQPCFPLINGVFPFFFAGEIFTRALS